MPISLHVCIEECLDDRPMCVKENLRDTLFARPFPRKIPKQQSSGRFVYGNGQRCRAPHLSSLNTQTFIKQLDSFINKVCFCVRKAKVKHMTIRAILATTDRTFRAIESEQARHVCV